MSVKVTLFQDKGNNWQTSNDGSYVNGKKVKDTDEAIKKYNER
ncbi:MAG: hypothetical protein ACPGXZ_06615 [Saprospiraceae bacterium]